MAMGDMIAVMDKGDVLQVGTPAEIYGRPATRFVAGFIGSPAMNFLPAMGPLAPGSRRVRVNGAEVDVPLLHEGLDHQDAMLGVRPEHVEVASDGPLRGRVFGVEYMGARQLITVETDAGRLKIRAPNSVRAGFGDTVGLRFKSAALVVFDGRTDRALKSDLIGDARG
jgi:multiple sugar transport system ATP-binding protein